MNSYHDESGEYPLDRPSLLPIVPPGQTVPRMLLRSIADALSLPPPATEDDNALRLATLDQRAKIVAAVCRRLADDEEADSIDHAVAAQAITDRVAEYPASYPRHPLAD